MAALVTRQKRAVLHPRRARLLAVIETDGGVWRTGEVMRLYRANGWGCNRSTARADLQWLARHGYLREHGLSDTRWYDLPGGHT